MEESFSLCMKIRSGREASCDLLCACRLYCHIQDAGPANALTCSLLFALASTWQFSATIVILSEVLRGRSDHPGATRPRAGGETRTHALLFTEQPPLPSGRLQLAVPRLVRFRIATTRRARALSKFFLLLNEIASFRSITPMVWHSRVLRYIYTPLRLRRSPAHDSAPRLPDDPPLPPGRRGGEGTGPAAGARACRTGEGRGRGHHYIFGAALTVCRTSDALPKFPVIPHVLLWITVRIRVESAWQVSNGILYIPERTKSYHFRWFNYS